MRTSYSSRCDDRDANSRVSAPQVADPGSVRCRPEWQLGVSLPTYTDYDHESGNESGNESQTECLFSVRAFPGTIPVPLVWAREGQQLALDPMISPIAQMRFTRMSLFSPLVAVARAVAFPFLDFEKFSEPGEFRFRSLGTFGLRLGTFGLRLGTFGLRLGTR